MASSLSVVHPTFFSHLFSWTFFCLRPFSPAPVVSINCLFPSSSTAAMTSKKIMKSASSQTNTIVPSSQCTIKVGNELNNGTIAPSTRRAFFKIIYVFLLSSKKIPFEQYYRLHLSGPNIAICETKSNNVIVLTHTSFDQNYFYFLHAVQEAVDAFIEVLKDFGFFQRLALYDPSKHPTQPNSATHTQNSQPGFL